MIMRKSSLNDVPPERIFVGVAGGSAAGKTTLCENINRQMAFDRNFKVEIISLDCFYKSINKEQDVSQYNFDHPRALDFDLAYEVLSKLKYSNEPVPIPQYSFVEHQRLPQSMYVNPANIILFEGLMAFHDERIRNMMTYKIFINCDDDIRLCRRLKRDTTERGRTVVSVLKQYNLFVKNAFRDFIYPTISYADLVIPGQRNNRISVDFIVQHIKNMAKKINIFQKAHKTKVFMFGENQYYDKNISQHYQTSISLVQESFLIFPTSDEHRKELQFFMNTLMSESFSQEYFKEIFVYQFMKIGRSLLRQLIELKGLKKDEIELFSIYESGQKLKKSNKSVKIIFVPAIFSSNENFLNKLKHNTEAHETIIILNIFCDMRFPNKVYQCRINGLIFMNLYIIPNKQRLLQIMNSNNMNLNENEDFSWFTSDQEIIKQALIFVSTQLGVLYENNLQKQYDSAVKSCIEQKTSPYTYKLTQKIQYGQILLQIPTQPQEHQNLCGFHSLHNIRAIGEEIMGKKNFLKTFEKIQNLLRPTLSYIECLRSSKFDPLERKDIEKVLSESIFAQRNVSVLFLSEGYVTNSSEENQTLVRMIDHVKEGIIDALHILVGCFNHYFVLYLKDKHIFLLDSLNTPIADIMTGKISLPKPTAQDYGRYRDMKTSIELVEALYTTSVPLPALILRLRIDAIVGSYEKLKNEEEKFEWLKNEYPTPVIKSDLIEFMEEDALFDLGSEYTDRLRRWFSDEFVQKNAYPNAEQALKKLQK